TRRTDPAPRQSGPGPETQSPSVTWLPLLFAKGYFRFPLLPPGNPGTGRNECKSDAELEVSRGVNVGARLRSACSVGRRGVTVATRGSPRPEQHPRPADGRSWAWVVTIREEFRPAAAAAVVLRCRRKARHGAADRRRTPGRRPAFTVLAEAHPATWQWEFLYP